MKTTLKFSRAHIHAGVRYAEGQVEEFDLFDAKQILGAGSATVVNNPISPAADLDPADTTAATRGGRSTR